MGPEMRGGTRFLIGAAFLAAAIALWITRGDDLPREQALAEEGGQEPADLQEADVKVEIDRPEPVERGLGEPVRHPKVLVRRGRRELLLFDGDVLVKRYPVQVGESLEGDKEREGDRRTPLGTFYVCTRNDKSRFHRFLGLSYPAPEDAERGLREGMISRTQYKRILEAHQQKRQPPWKTPLGGEVGIHGGGSDREGTLGCVAVTDAEIRELWGILKLGTPVVIEP